MKDLRTVSKGTEININGNITLKVQAVKRIKVNNVTLSEAGIFLAEVIEKPGWWSVCEYTINRNGLNVEYDDFINDLKYRDMVWKLLMNEE